MKIRVAALVLWMGLGNPAWAGQLPAMELENLAGDTVQVPGDLKGETPLIILAFAHEQRDEAARVIALLQEAQQSNPALSWYEMPVIDAPLVAQFFIMNGMRSGTDESIHSHIIPQFVDEDEWRTATGISSTDPLLAKTDAHGTILKTAPLGTIHDAAAILAF